MDSNWVSIFVKLKPLANHSTVELNVVLASACYMQATIGSIVFKPLSQTISSQAPH